MSSTKEIVMVNGRPFLAPAPGFAVMSLDFKPGQREDFLSKVEDLRKHYGLDTIDETIVEMVARAAKEWL